MFLSLQNFVEVVDLRNLIFLWVVMLLMEPVLRGMVFLFSIKGSQMSKWRMFFSRCVFKKHTLYYVVH